jgi:hypothetical protein
MKEYHSPDEITDSVIIEAFKASESIGFAARPSNYIKYRTIMISGVYWSLPLSRVLPLVGITPEMLRPVFDRKVQLREMGRFFPLNLSWFGLNKKTTKIKAVIVSLPEKIDDYDQLGCFQLSAEPFQKLAKIINKTIHVWRQESDTTEGGFPLFTVFPDGSVIMDNK